MAMTMNGEVQLAAPREAVWAKLNDPAILKACIPGCEELEKVSDSEFRATAKMKVGPVSARFKGRVMLSDSIRRTATGSPGKARAVSRDSPRAARRSGFQKDGGTVLSYNVDAQIGGKLAQLGQRLINGSAKKMADEFFCQFRGSRAGQATVTCGCPASTIGPVS